MSDRFYIQKNRLIIDDITEIIFDFPIRESIEIGDMLIVYISF